MEGKTEEKQEVPPTSTEEKKQEDEIDKEYKKIVSNFPEEVKPRFVALKSIADKREELQRELDRKIEELERKYEQLYKPLDNNREQLVNGLREPEPEELSKMEEYKVPTAEKGKTELDVEQLKSTKGLPDFWLKVMENSRILSHFIKEHDKPILKHLTNVRTEKLEDNDYRIIFTFSPNEYFKDNELIKTMIMDKEDNEICKETRGTEIQWNEGKNITVKVIKKKQKNKSKVILRQ